MMMVPQKNKLPGLPGQETDDIDKHFLRPRRRGACAMTVKTVPPLLTCCKRLMVRIYSDIHPNSYSDDSIGK
jgi:hypothetical protein